MTIRPAVDGDLPGIARLLEGAGLPTEDLPPQTSGFFVSFTGESLVGVIGLERYGGAGLLRSLAVDRNRRGRGTGQALCETLLRYSEAEGVRDLYLLTTDAAVFFERLGFAVIDRTLAPAEIKRSREFAGLCPETATLMFLRLPDTR